MSIFSNSNETRFEYLFYTLYKFFYFHILYFTVLCTFKLINKNLTKLLLKTVNKLTATYNYDEFLTLHIALNLHVQR